VDHLQVGEGAPGILHTEHLSDVTPLSAVDPSQLNADQLRAYKIITWHLDQTLAGNNPPPLQMILYGEGGTGKGQSLRRSSPISTSCCSSICSTLPAHIQLRHQRGKVGATNL
jgi:hypothetical protein